MLPEAMDWYQEMKAKLIVLQNKADHIISVHSKLSGDINVSPYRASLGMYLYTQFAEVLGLMETRSI